MIPHLAVTHRADDSDDPRVMSNGQIWHNVFLKYLLTGAARLPVASLIGWLEFRGPSTGEQLVAYRLVLEIHGIDADDAAAILQHFKAVLAQDRRQHRFDWARLRGWFGRPHVGTQWSDPDDDVKLDRQSHCDGSRYYNIMIRGIGCKYFDYIPAPWASAEVAREYGVMVAAILQVLTGTAATPGEIAARVPLSAEIPDTILCEDCPHQCDTYREKRRVAA